MLFNVSKTAHGEILYSVFIDDRATGRVLFVEFSARSCISWATVSSKSTIYIVLLSIIVESTALPAGVLSEELSAMGFLLLGLIPQASFIVLLVQYSRVAAQYGSSCLAAGGVP